jgi:hypothetical protein
MEAIHGLMLGSDGLAARTGATRTFWVMANIVPARMCSTLFSDSTSKLLYKVPDSVVNVFTSDLQWRKQHRKYVQPGSNGRRDTSLNHVGEAAMRGGNDPTCGFARSSCI